MPAKREEITMSKDNNTCPYNTAVICGPRDWENKTAKRECNACSWNPDVAEARLKRICKTMGVAVPEMQKGAILTE